MQNIGIPSDMNPSNIGWTIVGVGLIIGLIIGLDEIARWLQRKELKKYEEWKSLHEKELQRWRETWLELDE